MLKLGGTDMVAGPRGYDFRWFLLVAEYCIAERPKILTLVRGVARIL